MVQEYDKDCERTSFAVSKIGGAIEDFAGKNSEVIWHFLNLAIVYK